VKDVAGKDVTPVPFAVDWDMFREAVHMSLRRIACQRQDDWLAPSTLEIEEEEGSGDDFIFVEDETDIESDD